MNKIVLITGASSGIGEGCARKFASEGAKLILNSRSADKLEALAMDLKRLLGMTRRFWSCLLRMLPNSRNTPTGEVLRSTLED